LGVDCYSIEIKEKLYEELVDKMKDWKKVHIKRGDGYYGWPEHGEYDAIIITCAAKHEIPPPLIKQLKMGGCIIVPVEHANQTQVLYKSVKVKEGELDTMPIIPVRFVPFTREKEQEVSNK